MAIFGNLAWTMLLIPILVVLLAVFAFGIGLMLSVGNVFFRDVSYIVGIGLNLLFYATPIVYPESLITNRAPMWAQHLVAANPIFQFVKAMRKCVYFSQVPTLGSILILLAISVSSFGLGWMTFRRFGRDVSEEL